MMKNVYKSGDSMKRKIIIPALCFVIAALVIALAFIIKDQRDKKAGIEAEKTSSNDEYYNENQLRDWDFS